MRWLASLLLMVAGVAQAQTFPPLTGRVVDAASIIPDDQEAALTAKLDALEKESSRQLVVATVPSLEGYDISDYGYRLGRAWGIGQKDQNNGSILLVAPNDRKVRIEVGYGLEPILPDLWLGRIRGGRPFDAMNTAHAAAIGSSPSRPTRLRSHQGGQPQPCQPNAGLTRCVVAHVSNSDVAGRLHSTRNSEDYLAPYFVFANRRLNVRESLDGLSVNLK